MFWDLLKAAAARDYSLLLDDFPHWRDRSTLKS